MVEEQINNNPPEDISEDTPEPSETIAETASLNQDKGALKIILKAKGSFTLTGEDEKEIEANSAQLVLDEEKLAIFSESGKSFPLFLRDVEHYVAKDYTVTLNFPTGGKLILSDLGYVYDDFVNAFTKVRQRLIEKDLLMEEGGKKTSYAGDYLYQKENQTYRGRAKVAVYDTGIIIRPTAEDTFRIPFAEVNEVTEKDYVLTVNTDNATLTLSQFGEKLDLLNSAIREALGQLSLRAQEVFRALFPALDPLIVKAASEVLRDGKVVTKEAIDKISPQIWPEVEKSLTALNIKDTYDFLMSLNQKGQIYLGIKKDLMGELTKEYLYFLIPISYKGYEFLAFESASTAAEGSKATYLFKAIGEDIASLVKQFNRCMLAINFRREPIYLAEADLEQPSRIKYKIAISKIPELRLLRKLYVGRLAHHANWQENILILMEEAKVE